MITSWLVSPPACYAYNPPRIAKRVLSVKRTFRPNKNLQALVHKNAIALADSKSLRHGLNLGPLREKQLIQCMLLWYLATARQSSYFFQMPLFIAIYNCSESKREKKKLHPAYSFYKWRFSHRFNQKHSSSVNHSSGVHSDSELSPIQKAPMWGNGLVLQSFPNFLKTVQRILTEFCLNVDQSVVLM